MSREVRGNVALDVAHRSRLEVERIKKPKL